MRVTTYVDLGSKEIEVDVSTSDMMAALSEAFAIVEREKNDERVTRHDILRALNSMAGFLNAISDEMISDMLIGQRMAIAKFIAKNAKRFEVSDDELRAVAVCVEQKATR